MSRWKRWFPGFQILSDYKAAWFPHDVIAGLVLTTMLVPVGIAYALASGVPGIYGLWWRRHACGSRREYDGRGIRFGVRADRCVAPGLHHRTPLEAYPVRLYERHR